MFNSKPVYKFTYSEEELERFREVQRLAYECAIHIGDTLTEGVTEKETTKRMRAWLEDHGVDAFFHVPFAWFGDRTAFKGFGISPFSFGPTDRQLEPGMPFILDVAPAVDGYACDIGYAGYFGDSERHDRMLDALLEYRELILKGVLAGRTLRDIYFDVNELAADHGFVNRHKKYPQNALGHLVFRLEPSWDEKMVVMGFGAPVLRRFIRDIAASYRGFRHHSPVWNHHRTANHPATPGLWAVEPHLGDDGLGVKFEELMVVTDSDAYWLDDDLPHVRRGRGKRVEALPRSA